MIDQLLESLICEAPLNLTQDGLKKWNMHQMQLWIELSKKKHVKYDDMGTFAKMAKYFDSYYKRTKRFVNYADLQKGFLPKLD